MRSIIQRDKSDGCFLCRGEAVDEHHCIGGNNRHKSDEWGLMVYLCRRCHEGIHNAQDNTPQMEAKRFLEKVAQKEFEKRYGHSKFMTEFRQNYL